VIVTLDNDDVESRQGCGDMTTVPGPSCGLSVWRPNASRSVQWLWPGSRGGGIGGRDRREIRENFRKSVGGDQDQQLTAGFV
jgi:hypothetical protein